MNDSLYPLNDTSFAGAHMEVDGKKNPSFHIRLPRVQLQEVIYQVVIVILLLVFYSFKLDESETLSFHTLFTPSKLAFFANYLSAAMAINYILLPVFYYRKRMILFVVALSFVLTLVILIDEFILEQIFFADTRGDYFPGILYTLVEILPIIIIIVAFKLAWDSNRKQSEVERLKSLVREGEIRFLKSQINPHFLFNNLNNLYAYAIENSPRTPSIILEIAAVLRYMLYDCKANAVALTKEIQHLENYIALNKLQIENRGEINFFKAIANSNFSIPPLMLIVFVENAFKHSSGTLASNIKIDISLQLSEDGKLLFVCKNNYSKSFHSTTTAKGIGLENVRKRLDLQYRDGYDLDIQDDGDVFITTLSMQLKNGSV